MSSRGALEVIVFSDSKYVGSLMFTSPQITVGRDPRAMVRLDDPWVSLKHALIHFNGSTTIFEDVGSRNGATVRGERVTKIVVRPTDEVEIGKFRIRFVVHALDDQPAPAKQEPTAVFAIPGQAGQKKPERPDVTPTGPISGGGVMSLFDDQPTTVGTDEAPARREIVSEDHTRPEMKKFDSIPETPQIEPAYTPPPERVEATVRQAAPTAPQKQPQPAAQAPKKEAAKKGTPQTDTEPGHSLDEVEAALAALGGTPVKKDESTTRLDPLPPPAKREEPTRKVEPKPAPRSKRPDPSGQTPPPEKAEKQARAEKPAAGIAETRAPSATASRAAEKEKPAPAQASSPFLGDDMPQYAPKLPPPERVHHDDDDDEDDDADFVPSFSLIEALKGRGVDSDTLDSVDVTVETVAYCGEEVLAIRHLAVKGKLGKFLTRNEARKLTVAIGQVPAVEVYDSGRLIPESESARAGDGKSTISLRPGLSAVLHTSEKDRLFVHFVPKALPPPKPELKLRPDNIQIALAGGSIGTHILVFAIVGITAALHTEAVDLNEGRFAKIQTKDLELEPPPPPPPEPEPEPEPPKPEAPQSPIPQPKVKTKPIPMPHMKGPKVANAGPPGPPQPSAAANSILGALKQSSINNGPQATAVTNLDAVSAPRAGGGFKVSGAIGKLPGDTLRIGAAGSGTGRVDTKTAAELGAHNLGKITGAGTPSGKVRGLVTAPPARTVEVQGQLDRGEIQKVVNAHLREVQGCYERKLIKDPTLSGKIIFEWVISLTGSVTVVKVKFSDLRNAEVTSCIQSSIRTWHFPEPRGGSVTVTYPFVFSTMGM